MNEGVEEAQGALRVPGGASKFRASWYGKGRGMEFPERGHKWRRY